MLGAGAERWRPAPSSWSARRCFLGGLDQLVGAAAGSASERLDDGEGGLAEVALEQADVRGVQVGGVGECFVGESGRLPLPPEHTTPLASATRSRLPCALMRQFRLWDPRQPLSRRNLSSTP